MSKYETFSKEQVAWDKLLYDGWKQNVPMGNLFVMMKMDYPNIEVDRLRRIPDKIHYKYAKTVCVFVAKFLPKLSEKLFDGISKEDFLFYLFLNGDKIDTQFSASDFIKSRAEVSTLSGSKRKFGLGGVKSQIMGDFFNRSNKGGQWNVCK
jgi:hypothetical protein